LFYTERNTSQDDNLIAEIDLIIRKENSKFISALKENIIQRVASKK
jgi:hypothetical protein